MDGKFQHGAHVSGTNPTDVSATIKPRFAVVRDDRDQPRERRMKLSRTMNERLAAFRLVHQMYCRAGLSSDHHGKMRVMPHHLLDTTDVLVSLFNKEVDFTVTLVRDGMEGLPSESLFPEEIQAMRGEGLRLAEVSCLASGCHHLPKKEQIETLVAMIGLTIHVARRRNVDRLLLAVHPRHAKVYRRMFGCEPCSEVKEYAAVEGNPAVLCIHDFTSLDETKYSLYDKVYGVTYAPWELDGIAMTNAEKNYLRSFVQEGSLNAMPMAA